MLDEIWKNDRIKQLEIELQEARLNRKVDKEPEVVDPLATRSDPYKIELENKRRLLHSQFGEVGDLVEALRADITQRQCSPSSARIDFVQKETESLDNLLSAYQQLLEESKSFRKKNLWEKELERIVKEQASFKDLEIEIAEFIDDYNGILDIFDQMQSVLSILSKGGNGNNDQSKRSNKSTNNLNLLSKSIKSGSSLEELKDIKEEMMRELSFIPSDSEQRLKAIAISEKIRKAEQSKNKEDRLNDNPFENELTNFVTKAKFTNIGGFEEIERRRSLKNEEMLKGLVRASSIDD